MADINTNVDPEKMEEFLEKVDEIEAIVKGLKATDQDTADDAMKQADRLIAEVDKVKKNRNKDDEDDASLQNTKTGFNKSHVNKYSEDVPGQKDPNFYGMDNIGFMKAVEADANERAARRKERMKFAEEYKEKGNVEFRQGNYEQALEWYTQGLREIKDHSVLYTNRAQTYIKLGKYKEAIVDCDWALRAFPNCLKAYIHMGRAHLALKEYKEARECYNKALTCDPKKETVIKEYLAEVDRTELAEKQEKDAEEVFKEGNPEVLGIVEVLTKIQRPEQLPLFYSGGFRILKSLLKTTSDRTLFRTKGGLEMLTTLPTLHKCISASPKSLSGEELDMLTSAFEMYSEACLENEKSTEVILHTTGLPGYCIRFLDVKMKGQGKILKHAIVNFLFTLSQMEIGQRTIVETFDIPKLLATIFTIIRTNSKTATTAANLLNNLALEKKFKSLLRDKIEETVSPAFEQLVEDSSPCLATARCITMVTNLTADQVIRSKLQKRKQLWKVCCSVLGKHRVKLTDSLSKEIVDSILGLFSNLTSEKSDCASEIGAELCEHCMGILEVSPCPENLEQRAVILLSHVLPNCASAVEPVVTRGGTGKFLDYLKTESHCCLKPAMKALTGLTQTSEGARKYIVDNKGLGSLMKLLKSTDEVVVGNAALCLSHCTQVPKMCAALTKTDIIKDLLVLARDGKRPAVQQNCAILTGKLAQGDSKHLERLRELHGIEILHGCMKYIK